MQENKDGISYKIMAGKRYRVYKLVFDDKVYYRIQIQQKNYDNTVSKFYKQVSFKRGIELENETDIIIHKAFENVRANPLDKYNPISTLMITDYEVVERQEQIEKNAFNDYRASLEEANTTISDDDLAF